MRGADSVDDRIDLAAGLPPDFVAEAEIAIGAILILQLVGPPVARLPADFARPGDHRLNQFPGDLLVVARHVGDLGAKGPHGPALLVAEGIGKYEMGFVAQRPGHQRQ